jgi:hypothetical protein
MKPETDDPNFPPRIWYLDDLGLCLKCGGQLFHGKTVIQCYDCGLVAALIEDDEGRQGSFSW